ncbi:uncharacterized protein LOC142807353 isoform X2 [Rhipicephalus microplus]|uniref:uncharacterized protein LOC142807353 isoform X2 n=1 Tax=Rhipicephalus microplus TaxID=6941 RepID=UPI003F6AC789
MGPVRPGLLSLVLLALLARSAASIIGRGGTARQLQGNHACPTVAGGCPRFEALPASLSSILCDGSKSVILVTVGLAENPRLKAPSWLSPQRLLAVQVDRNMADGSMAVRVSNRSDGEGALTLDAGTCKRFKVKKVFDLSPNTEAKPLAGLAELLVSNDCDTRGVFAQPGHVLIVSEKSLGNVAEADVLSLGDGTAAYRLPNNGSVTTPACFDVQRRPGYTPPENAVLVSDTEPDVAVPCQIGRQPIGLGCPVCPVGVNDELKQHACTAPTAFVVRRNAERLTEVAPLRTVRKINIRIQQRRPLGGNESGSTTCVMGSLSILDDVSPGGIDTAANHVNFIMRSHCNCEFLHKDAGYAVLLSDKPIPRTGRTVHLDESFTLASLPDGVTNLTSCSSRAADEADVMLGDQPLGGGQSPPVVAAPAPPLAHSCPVCHSELEADLYNPICGAQTVVRMLSLNPAATGPSGMNIGKARIVQSVRGPQDKIGNTLIYTMPQNCKCDYVTKPSRQYFVFTGQLSSAPGKPTHVPFTEQMHILAYSYRNARLLHDALSACPSTSIASLGSIQKRMDGYAVADQAEYAGSYGGASGPLYGSGAGAPHHSNPKIAAGYGPYEAVRSAPASHGAPSYGAAPSSQSHGGIAYSTTSGKVPAYGPASAPGSAVRAAAVAYVAQPSPPAYGVTASPGNGYAQSSSNYNDAMASHGKSAVTASSAPSPSYSGGGAVAYMPAAPSYGRPPAPSHSNAPASGQGVQAQPSNYGPAPQPTYYSGSGPTYGSHIQGSSYNDDNKGAAKAPGYGPAHAPSYGATAGGGYGSANAANYGAAGAMHAPNHVAPAPSASYGAGGHDGASASLYNQGDGGYGTAAPSYGSGAPSSSSYVATPAGSHHPAAPSYGPSSYNSVQQKAPIYGSPTPGYESPSSGKYGSGMAASYGSVPSPGYNNAPTYAPASNAGYGPPAAAYSNGALPSSADYGSGYRPPAAEYVKAPSPNYGPPPYNVGKDAAHEVTAYDGYRDVTYVPPHGMTEYPPSAYESLYPTYEDYATVISYVPTDPSEQDYYAGNQDSRGNAGYDSNSVTYSSLPYSAPVYAGPTYAPPAYTVAPSSYGANFGYDSPYGTYAPATAGHSAQALKEVPSSPAYSSAPHNHPKLPMYNPPPPAPANAPPSYPSTGSRMPTYSGAAVTQSYGSASQAASAVSYSPPSYAAAPAYAQPVSYNTAGSGSSPYFPPKYPLASKPSLASPSQMYPSPYKPPVSYTVAPAAPAYAAPQSYGQEVHKPSTVSKPSYINMPVSAHTYGPPPHSASSYGAAAAAQGMTYVMASYGSSSHTATASAPTYTAPKPNVPPPQYASAPASGNGNSYNPSTYFTTAGYSGPSEHDASYGMAPSYRSLGNAYEQSKGRNPSYNGESSPSYAAPAYGTDDTQPSSYDASSSQAYTTSSYGSVSYTTQGSNAASYSATYASPAHSGPAYSQPSNYAPTKTEPVAPLGPAEYTGATHAPPPHSAASYSNPSYSASSAPPSYSAPSYSASNTAPASASQAYNPSYGAAGAAMPSYVGSPSASPVVYSGVTLYSATMSPQVYPVVSYAPPAYVAPNYAQPSYAVTYAPPAYAAPTYHVATAAPPTYSHPSYSPSYAPPAYSAPAYASMPTYGSAPQKPLYQAPAYITVTYAPMAYVPGQYDQPSYTPPAYSAPVYPPNVQPGYAAAAYPVPAYANQPYSQPSPQYTHPSYNQPQHGGATYAPPAYSAPSYEASYAPPAYSAPSYVHPSYNMPANSVSYAPPTYASPQYPQPAYGSVSYTPPASPATYYSKPVHTQPSYGIPSTPIRYNAPVSGGPAYGHPAHMVTAQHAPSYGGHGNAAAAPHSYLMAHPPAPAYGVNAGQNTAHSKPSYPRYPQQAVTLSYTLPAQPLPPYYSPSYGKPVYGGPADAYGPTKLMYSPAPQQAPVHSATYAPAGPQAANSYGQPPTYGSGANMHVTSAPASHFLSSYYASEIPIGANGGNGAYGAPAGAPTYQSGGENDGSYGQGASQHGAYTTVSYTASVPAYESTYTTYSPSAPPQYATDATPSSYSPSYTTYTAPTSQSSYTTYGYSPSTHTTHSTNHYQQSYTTHATPAVYSPATTMSPAYSGHSDPDYQPSVNGGPASYGATYPPTVSAAPSYSPPSYYPPASYSAPADYTTMSYSAATHAPQGYISPSYRPPTYSAPSYGDVSHAPPGFVVPTAGYPQATHAPPGYSAASYSPQPYSAPPHPDPSYHATDAPAGYAAATQMPSPYSASVYTAATHAPAAQPAPAYSPSMADYRPPAADYPPPPQVQPAYGRSVHPEALTHYAPAKTIEPTYSQAYPMGSPDVPPYKPRCPQASNTCPICPPVLHKELLKNICNYDLIAETEVSYPPQAGKSYGGLCSEMCVGEVLHGTASVMDKIRFSVNKYCSCNTASKEYAKVIVFSKRHSWHSHGGSYGELMLDDKTVILPSSKDTLKAITEAIKQCNRGHRYPGAQAYADAAYAGPAGCPDPFDETCPRCTSAVSEDSLAKDLCTSEYASVVAIGLDYKKMAVYKNGRFTWKQTYLPDIEVNEETAFSTNLSVVIKVNATPPESALAKPETSSLTDSCLTYTVKALYNVSHGSDPVADMYDLQLYLNKQCPCQQLKSQLPGYALLVVDKQSKLSDGVLQLGTGVKLYPLPYGTHVLPPCSAQDDAINPRSDPGPETKLPLPELKIPHEDGETDAEPCPENVKTTCPVCIDASEEPAATATQYCKSQYAAVVSIPDDAFTASTDESAIQPWWAPKLTLSTVSHGSSVQVNVDVKPKARYQFPQTDRTVGHADEKRKCRSGKLHVKQQITSDREGEAMDTVKFTIMSSCNCGFLEQPTQFAVLASKLAPESGQPLHLSEDVTLIGLPLGKTELPKCVRVKPTRKSFWGKFW